MRLMNEILEKPALAPWGELLSAGPGQVGGLQESDAEKLLDLGDGRLLALTSMRVVEEVTSGLYRDPRNRPAASQGVVVAIRSRRAVGRLRRSGACIARNAARRAPTRDRCKRTSPKACARRLMRRVVFVLGRAITNDGEHLALGDPRRRPRPRGRPSNHAVSGARPADIGLRIGSARAGGALGPR